jgi:hypothetical protein
VGLDAAKKGGNKQMREIRGELINVIKKPKRLLDAVRKPCWRKVDAYSKTEGGISGYSNKPKNTPIQLPFFFSTKRFIFLIPQKLNYCWKNSLQKLKPYSWINAALAGKNKQVWSNTSARIFTDHKYLLLSASFQSASFHLSYFEGIKIARERTLSLLGLWRVNFSFLLCIL